MSRGLDRAQMIAAAPSVKMPMELLLDAIVLIGEIPSHVGGETFVKLKALAGAAVEEGAGGAAATS